MNPNVDLKQLAVRRDDSGHGRAGRPRNIGSRYVLPAVLVGGFALVIGWAARDAWLPAREVTVVPVLATKAQVRTEGTPLFNAAGWVEPRPTEVDVTALTEGVVEELLVVEGQDVAAGEPVARLIEADARLTCEAAMAALMLEHADEQRAKAALRAAEINLANPVALQAELAQAEAELAQAETELAHLPLEKEEAEARLQYAQQDLDGKRQAGAGVPVRSLQKAESDLATAQAELHRAEVRGPLLERQVQALRDRRDALSRRLELKTDEQRAVDEGKAAVAAAEARVLRAQVECDTNQLMVARLTVRAPVAGRVLALVAGPGSRVMGLSPDALYDASTVVTLYDPAMLQVRADVRLENVPQVQPGQKVRIRTDAVQGDLEGEVLRITSLTDSQKNTLQIKIAIHDPPPVLKPEMLVQTTFLAPPSDAEGTPSEELRLFVPRPLVEQGEAGDSVWVADQAAGLARRRVVKLGQAGQEDLVEVVEGLRAGDRLIVQGREGLTEGERIKIVGEESET